MISDAERKQQAALRRRQQKRGGAAPFPRQPPPRAEPAVCGSRAGPSASAGPAPAAASRGGAGEEEEDEDELLLEFDEEDASFAHGKKPRYSWQEMVRRDGTAAAAAASTDEITASAPVARSSVASSFFGEASGATQKDQLARQIGIVALGNAARLEQSKT